MSREIDERVVSMEFDNKQFESNVQTSLSTIEKLKKSLKLDKAAQGLQEIDRAAKKVDLSPLSNSAETVGLRFNALYTIADQAFRNMYNSASMYAKRIVSAFTIDPVKTGFQEYETQIGAVQTILANTQSKGTTLDDVNSALDELNKYADMTIYNFTEMTRNIGTFTAAGVDLDKSVTAIKGIANLAAISGSTSQQASTAMYQLSQALASGTVKLMDWNSVVNAGMGGQVFQDALKETARLHGVAIDQMIEDEGSFRETLKDGWLTSEILIETLSKFTDTTTELGQTATDAATKVKTFTQLMDTLKEAAQSGWTQTWEYIVGDFEQAKHMWTAVSDTVGGFINSMSDSRNKMLEGAMVSSWDKLIKKVNDAGIETSEFEAKIRQVADAHQVDLDGAIQRYGSLSEAFRQGELSVNLIREALNGFNKTSSKSGEAAEELKTHVVKAGDTLSSIARKNGMTWQELWELNKDVVKDPNLIVDGWVLKLNKASESTGESTEAIITDYESLINTLDQKGGRELLIESVSNAFKGLMNILKPIGTAFREVFKPITSDQLYGFLEWLNEITGNFKKATEDMTPLQLAFKGLFSVVKLVLSVAGKLAAGLGKILFGSFAKLSQGILPLLGQFGDMISKFIETINVGDLVSTIMGGAGTVLEWIIGILGDLAGHLVVGAMNLFEFVKGLLMMPKVQNGLKKVKASFVGIADTLKGKWSEGVKRLKEFYNSLRNMDSFSLENIKTVFLDFKKKILDYFIKNEDGTTIFDGLINAVKNLWGSVSKYFEDAGIKFEEVGGKIVTFFESVAKAIKENSGAIAAIAILSGLFVGIWKIFDVLKNFSAALSVFEGFGDLMDEVGQGVDRVSKALSFRLKAEAIKSIATAIAILAGSLIALTLVDQTKLLTSTGALLTLTIALGLLAVTMSKVDNIKDMGKIAGTVLGLAGSILILAFAAKMIGGMNADELKVAGIAIGAFVGVIVLLSKVTKGAEGSLLDFGKMMLLLSGSLVILSFVIKTLGGMDRDALQQGGTAVALFLGMMVGMMAATRLIAKDMPKFGGTMIALSGALLLMTMSVGILGKMDIGTILKGGIAAAAFLGMMVGMMAATKLLAKDMPKFGLAMTGISFGLLAMALAVKVLAGMEVADIVKGGLVVAAFLGLTAVMMAATKLLGKNAGASAKFGAMMLAFSGAMLILTASIAVLSFIKPEALDKAIEAIAKVGLIFGAMMALTKFAQASTKDSKLTGTIIGLAAAIGIIAVSIAALSFIDGSKLAAATTAISVVIGMFALLVASTKFLGKGVIGPLLVMVGGITILAGAIYLLANVGAGSEAALQVALSMSALILALSVSFTFLSKIPVTGALTGIASLAVIIAGVGLIMAALAGLNRLCPDLASFLNEGMPILEAVGTAIGSFFGSIAGGFLEGMSSGLPGVGTNLSDFMTNLSGFIEGAKTIDSAALDGATNLALMIAAISGASLIEGITSWLTGGSSMTDFATQIIPFGNAMVEFSSIVSGNINEDAITAAANAGKVLSEMAKTLPNSGGVAGFFAGENDLSTFAPQLIPFGQAMVGFSSTVAGNINEDAVTAAANAGKVIAEMAAMIPNTGGLVSWFAGDNDMTTFGAGLIEFGTAIVTFSSTVAGSVNEDAVTAAANAGKLMAEMANTIPNTGGLVAFLCGDNSMVTFGAQLVLFGRAIKNFSAEVSGLDTAAVDTAVAAGTSLSIMANSLPESGGLWSVFSKDNDLSTFASEIKKFGTGIKDFATEVVGIKPVVVTAAVTAATEISSLAGELTEDKNVNLEGFGSTISNLGWYLSGFYANVKEIDSGKLSNMASALRDLASIDVTSADSLQSFVDSLADVGLDGITAFVDSFNDNKPTMIQSVVDTFTQLKNTITANSAGIVESFNTVANNAVTAINAKYESFKSAGKYLVDGFAAGIGANTFKATAKAAAMATLALEAAKLALGIKSPSKEFYKIGAFTGEGFVNALGDYERKTYKAGEGIAESAKSGLGDAIDKIRYMIENGVDTQPTIRPVLDLSDVSSGAAAINGMFDMSPSVATMSRVGTINATMNNRQNGFSNSDVVKAIKDLGAKIGTGGDTVQVGNVTYDDGSNVSNAVGDLIRAMKVERRK